MVKKALTLALILLMAWTSLGLGVEATPALGSVILVATYDAKVTSANVKSSADTYLDNLEIGATDDKSAMEFNTAVIPDSADVLSIILTWKKQTRTEDVSFVKWDDNTNTLTASTGAQMQTAIGATNYVTVNPTVAGTVYNTELGATAWADLEADLVASRDWWVVGTRTTNGGWRQYLDSLETVSGQDPTIRVSFTVPGQYNYKFTDRKYESGVTWDASYSLTATETDGESAVLTVDGDTYVYCDDYLDYVAWPISSDMTRFLYSPVLATTGTQDLYANETWALIYQYNIKDYSNVLTSPAYLEAHRIILGADELITSMAIMDTLNGIPLILQYSALYEIVVKMSDNSTYSQGFILAGDDLEINILLKEMTFTQTAQLSYKWVTVEAQRPNNTWIQFAWDNTLTPDYDISTGTLYLYFRNGTLVTSSDCSAESGTFNYYTADNLTDYRVKTSFSHEYLGAINYEKVLPGAEAGASDFPDLSVLGTFGGIDMTKILAYASMFIVAGGVSFISVPLGALGLISLAGFYSWRGIIPVDSTFLWTVMGLVALLFLASRRGG